MWFKTLSNLALQLACESPSSKAERKAQHAAMNSQPALLTSRDLRQQLHFFFRRSHSRKRSKTMDVPKAKVKLSFKVFLLISC